jgi:hypothetical protein
VKVSTSEKGTGKVERQIEGSNVDKVAQGINLCDFSIALELP